MTTLVDWISPPVGASARGGTPRCHTFTHETTHKTFPPGTLPRRPTSAATLTLKKGLGVILLTPKRDGNTAIYQSVLIQVTTENLWNKYLNVYMQCKGFTLHTLN